MENKMAYCDNVIEKMMLENIDKYPNSQIAKAYRLGRKLQLLEMQKEINNIIEGLENKGGNSGN